MTTTFDFDRKYLYNKSSKRRYHLQSFPRWTKNWWTLVH